MPTVSQTHGAHMESDIHGVTLLPHGIAPNCEGPEAILTSRKLKFYSELSAQFLNHGSCLPRFLFLQCAF